MNNKFYKINFVRFLIKYCIFQLKKIKVFYLFYVFMFFFNFKSYWVIDIPCIMAYACGIMACACGITVKPAGPIISNRDGWPKP